MIELGEQQRVHSPIEKGKTPVSLQEQWISQYGPLVAEQLRPEARYTLIRIGSAEFASTNADHYRRGLAQAWAAGFVPDPLPTATGRDLVQAAPNLRGVDLDLTDLSEADIASPRRRFS
jgi:hypothetical protein